MTASQPAPAREPRHLPISFSDVLIPKVLDGTKVQTRRAITPQPVIGDGGVWFPYPPRKPAHRSRHYANEAHMRRGLAIDFCPYGAPGDRLWVREGLRRNDAGLVSYAADGALALRDGKPVAWPWKLKRLAPRYCPRWASRIDLENSAVLVQRLQEITEADASVEGCGQASTGFRVYPGTGAAFEMTHRAGFSKLWDIINGKRPGCAWESNPFVWAVSFRRVRP